MRRAGIEQSSNASGVGGLKSEAAIGEAMRRADLEKSERADPSDANQSAVDGDFDRSYNNPSGIDNDHGSLGAGVKGTGFNPTNADGERETGPGVGKVDTGADYSGGHATVPVLLDLSGNGITIDPLYASSQFLDLDGDGYETRTAWAGDGTGVLVIDADGDGRISRSSEFAFTEWDETATSDLEALKSVFDTNHNGMLDADDARWSSFKVWVDGELISLAAAGVAAIDLTPSGSGQSFEDGSAITGTTIYYKTDGGTGTVGDAVLSAEMSEYIIKRSMTAVGGGDQTQTIEGYDSNGTLAFRNVVTTNAAGNETTTQFDDDGNGTFDRSQTDVTTGLAGGVRQRLVTNFSADGSRHDRTTTKTWAADKVETLLDRDGNGVTDQTQLFETFGNGQTTTTVTELNADEIALSRTQTTSSADGLVKTIKIDADGIGNGWGPYETIRTETTTIAGNGTRTKAVVWEGSDVWAGEPGLPFARETTVTSADGTTRTVYHDRDGAGGFGHRRVEAGRRHRQPNRPARRARPSRSQVCMPMRARAPEARAVGGALTFA
jgi:hypothetical protein